MALRPTDDVSIVKSVWYIEKLIFVMLKPSLKIGEKLNGILYFKNQATRDMALNPADDISIVKSVWYNHYFLSCEKLFWNKECFWYKMWNWIFLDF